MNLRSFVVVCAAAVAVIACGPQESSPGGAGTWGVTRLVEDLRIGQSEGPNEYLFGWINSIVQHPDGTVFISDGQVPAIRRYDAGGTYLHNVGREGQGPGEYQIPWGMQLLPDGNLAVWDPSHRRVTVFDPDGTWVKDFKTDGTQSRFWVDREGNSYLLRYKQDDEARTWYAPQSLLKYSPDGEPREAIEVPSEEPEAAEVVESTREGRLLNFSKQPVFTLTKSGHLVVGSTDDYSFEIREGERVLFDVRHGWKPVVVHPEEQAQWNDLQERYARRMREWPSQGITLPVFDPVPSTKPAFMDLWSGEDGTIWVRRYAEARERNDLPPPDPDNDGSPLTWWQYPTFDVFGSEGVFLGTVELPNDVNILWFHGDYIWTVQGNETDEDVAVRYRIEKGEL